MENLAKALVKFQSEVPVIPKNRTAKIPTRNGGSYEYTYADLGDIWAAIRQPLKDNGLAVTQGLKGGSDGYIGIETTIWHDSGETYATTVEAPATGKTTQEVGSLTTYYKRYALGAVLGISTEDDDDGKAGNSPQPIRSAASLPTPLSEAKAMLRFQIKEAGLNPEQAKGYAWVKDATAADIGKIKGLTEALKLGKVVEPEG